MSPRPSYLWVNILPPVTVRVANSYSATENPALLWAVTLRLYHVAGLRSRTTKFPPALTLFDTRVQSFWFLKCGNIFVTRSDVLSQIIWAVVVWLSW